VNRTERGWGREREKRRKRFGHWALTGETRVSEAELGSPSLISRSKHCAMVVPAAGFQSKDGVSRLV
jgi:hypothetical protein